MPNIEYLYKRLESGKDFIGDDKYAIPDYISNNLKYEFFDWQKAAFENLLINESNANYKKNPTHLMFNMATGTGKTLLMAATLLYYYKQGYKQFIFFVNQNNIVDKTENNFIDSSHNKYLFKPNIVIDDKAVNIKKVESFSDNPQSIEIKFTTIHKLYNDIHLERENQTTLNDLNNKNIVMFADEAHHLNANTRTQIGEQEEMDFKDELKNNASKKEVEKKGWEHTVIELILNKNGQSENNKNVLLEFTATIPENDQVAKKYEDKIVYHFGLKDFLRAGYTKEINLISSTFDKKQRILHALIFNWYRHKIALKNNIANFKSVILFRSKLIADSTQDYQDFLTFVNNIEAKDLNFLGNIKEQITKSKKTYQQGQSRTNDVLAFIENNNISYSEIASWIKTNFQEKNIIITNSKNGTSTKEKTTEEQEKLLNNLEDKNNHIRAIFTVKRLTEGWDVQNLFDIVRLYEGQNTGGTTERKGKVPEATTQEKQLIGRGVRYYPFDYIDKIKNKRKFDDDTTHELRILEELYYYAYDEDAKYISHLAKELKKEGYISDDRELKKFAVKPKFKETDFYQQVKVWHNKQENNPNRQKSTLQNIENRITYKVPSLDLKHSEVDFDGDNQERMSITQEQKTTPIKLKDIEKHIFNKAINIKAQQSNYLFNFEQLKHELKIDSMDDLLKDEFLGEFCIDFTHVGEIDNQDKLQGVLKLLTRVFSDLQKDVVPKIGSEFVFDSFDEIFGKPKTKYIDTKTLNSDVVSNDWYALDTFAGNSYEQGLIEFIKDRISNLKQKYEDVYLLRNEEVYKIYDFKKGRGFQPDFILFLKNKKQSIYYQVFIEPKGEYIADGDKWKEDFLLEISNKYGHNKIMREEDKNYRLIGLPFFMPNSTQKFKEKFTENLQI